MAGRPHTGDELDRSAAAQQAKRSRGRGIVEGCAQSSFSFSQREFCSTLYVVNAFVVVNSFVECSQRPVRRPSRHTSPLDWIVCNCANIAAAAVISVSNIFFIFAKTFFFLFVCCFYYTIK